MSVDRRALADLTAFARVEVESRDVEPWADLIAELHRTGVLNREQALWVVKLYNAYDDFGSAWTVYRRWEGPLVWAGSWAQNEAAGYPVTNERRNMRIANGLVLHLADYVRHFMSPAAAHRTQEGWVRLALGGDDARLDFARLMVHLRSVFQVGRQTAFEWAEFLAKVIGLPVEPADAVLWESEGPRRSIQRIYGEPDPSPEWLDDRAFECKAELAAEGVDLSWWDFETIICDFNVMRDGRYYPGRHLAALRGEIAGAPPDDREALLAAWAAVVPEPWCGIAPGIERPLLPVYRDTGQMVGAP